MSITQCLGGNMFGWHGMGFGMGLSTLIFWILMILAVVWLVRHLRSEKSTSDSALEIAKRRFAQGEIDKDQFDEIKRHI
ncbi:SHOCT domain-containing protein [Psychromonas ossibalaenae]|uniref:SHOCT domain-containing protein n=1 Tax=Psychromonas ossibalaenae TaxID=444922 RepID=UPI00036976FB|nr:SHOCT domain-containing protein [Psychromonas ossibalaenae]